MVVPFPSYGFVLDTFQEVGYLSGVLRIFLLHLPVYLRAVVYPIVYFLGGEHADIARFFILVTRPFDVVAVDILKMLHVGGYPVFVLFVYLVHMETDAVVRELYAHAVKCGVFTAYHVVAVFRLGHVLPYLLHEWRQLFFRPFRTFGKPRIYVKAVKFLF